MGEVDKFEINTISPTRLFVVVFIFKEKGQGKRIL